MADRNKPGIIARRKLAIEAMRSGLGYDMAADYALLGRQYVHLCAHQAGVWVESGDMGGLYKTDVAFGADLRRAHAEFVRDIMDNVEAKGTPSRLAHLKEGRRLGIFRPSPPGGTGPDTWNRFAEGILADAETEAEYQERRRRTIALLSDEARQVWEEAGVL